MGLAEPSPGVVFVGRYRIPAPRRDAWREAQRDLATFVRTELPDVLVFEAYLRPDSDEATSIHLHRSAESFDAYLAAAGPRIRGGTAIVEVLRIDLYGTPNPSTVERMRGMGPWPVEVHAPVGALPRQATDG